MKIAQSEVAFQSQHAMLQHRSSSVSIRQQQMSVNVSTATTQVAISQQGQHAAKTEKTQDDKQSALEKIADPKLRLISNLVEALTGQKLHLVDISDLSKGSSADLAGTASLALSPRSNADSQTVIQRDQLYIESEQLSFSAQGTVRTADGRELSFEFSMELSRDYLMVSHEQMVLQPAKPQDPLVLNFANHAAEFDSGRFMFDLLGSGEQQSLPTLRAGSAYLVLDHNKNGQVDDGRELFGPQTGNAYAELAAYDQDGNQWIDENDAVFDQLSVWHQAENRLVSLKQQQVGALYLGHEASPFTIKDPQNVAQAQLRDSGIFLSENGDVGSMQQLDLMV